MPANDGADDCHSHPASFPLPQSSSLGPPFGPENSCHWIKPSPFLSWLSHKPSGISPSPCFLKWASTSSFVSLPSESVSKSANKFCSGGSSSEIPTTSTSKRK